MSDQNPNCPCPDVTDLTIKGLKIDGLKLSIDPDSLPGGSGVEPGPDNTHLVSRSGGLAWDPIAPSGDGVNYSTEEQWTGKLWIDGKKIYQKTVVTQGLPASTPKEYAHDIPNVEQIVGHEAFYIHSGRMYPLPTSAPHPSEVEFSATSEKFRISTSRTIPHIPDVYVTLRSSCTDR